MARRVVFPAGKTVQMEEFSPAAPGQGQVAVRAIKSLLSTGTETIVFNRLFETGSHWDRWVKYPFYPGYAMVGEVTAVGGGVASVKAGDRVAIRAPHASHHVATAEHCYPIPKNVDPALAAWFALAKITFLGAQAAQHHVGQRVLIIGAGPIGQMSTRWARAAGAEKILVADRIAGRLDLARRGGATATIAKPVAEAEPDILAANDGELPDVVIDGTGNAAVFAAALKLARKYGRVVLLGDTGSPTQQRLTDDVVTRGLTIVGAHDGHSRAPWPESCIVRLFFTLLTDGRMEMDGMNTHEFAPEDCGKAYDLAANRRQETLGILFDWTKG